MIFHLAAVVSGEAEADFDKGYRVNLDGTRDLLEAIRRAHLADGYLPRLVFTSSIAVYGAPLPEPDPGRLPGDAADQYGTQKAIDELLLADFTRRGFVDGVGIRLPTICIRPGKPNLAASGFFSSILREPLVGQEAVLPVPDRRTALVRVAALGGRLPGARGDDRLRADRPGSYARHARASARPSGSRSRRCGGWPEMRRWP